MNNSLLTTLSIFVIASILLMPTGLANASHIAIGSEIADELYVDEQYVIRGGDGDDELYGDITNDYLYGQDGDDQLFGDEGNDLLDGGLGNDELFGEDGADTLRGGAGDDILYG